MFMMIQVQTGHQEVQGFGFVLPKPLRLYKDSTDIQQVILAAATQ